MLRICGIRIEWNVDGQNQGDKLEPTELRPSGVRSLSVDHGQDDIL
jgi:hypothetical protein